MYILGIETSCDDTSAAVLNDDLLLSNVTANQDVHSNYGGVVPELASRAHTQNIVPVVDEALRRAGITRQQLSAIAYTAAPGLPGSLIVGTEFATGLSLALGIPLVSVNHLEGHVMAHFIVESGKNDLTTPPTFPFLCLLVSGGNSQIIRMDSPNSMEIIGQTIDDAAGEAIDKCAKMMGLDYPGGPIIDKLARQGNAEAFAFAKPNIKGYDYSFSGLKTSVLYFLRDQIKENEHFIEERKADIAACVEKAVVDILMKKLIKAAKDCNISEIAVAGGVSANTGLRNRLIEEGKRRKWSVHIPPFSFTTDNAAMIAVSGYYKLKQQ